MVTCGLWEQSSNYVLLLLNVCVRVTVSVCTTVVKIFCITSETMDVCKLFLIVYLWYYVESLQGSSSDCFVFETVDGSI